MCQRRCGYPGCCSRGPPRGRLLALEHAESCGLLPWAGGASGEQPRNHQTDRLARLPHDNLPWRLSTIPRPGIRTRGKPTRGSLVGMLMSAECRRSSCRLWVVVVMLLRSKVAQGRTRKWNGGPQARTELPHHCDMHRKQYPDCTRVGMLDIVTVDSGRPAS